MYSVVLLLFLSSCNNKNEKVLIEECDDYVDSLNICSECCQKEGYDTGTPNKTAGSCLCWDDE